MKNEKLPYYLNEHGITYRKIRDGPNIFHAIMVPNALHSYILYESHKVLGHNGSTSLFHFIRRHYYWKRLHQHHNMYIHSCTEWQQVTLKDPQYINLHLLIPQFPMSFISMDLLGPYKKLKREINML